ncbi:MAG: hypothetical protein WCR54_07855, partial [Clostridia bacterium]
MMTNMNTRDNEQLTNFDIYLKNKAKRSQNDNGDFAQEEIMLDRQEVVRIKQPQINEIKENIQKVEKIENNIVHTKYDEYLLKMLVNRSSDEKLMTEDEFNENISNNKGNKLIKKIFGNIEFKKRGKIFLGFYVIIVLLLASILLIANTTGIAANTDAGASSISASSSNN